MRKTSLSTCQIAQGGSPDPPYFAGFGNPARAFCEVLSLALRVGAIVLNLAALQLIPATAAAPHQQVIGLLSFTLDKREAAKGETVLATYRLSRPARNVSITAGNYDGALVSFSFPQMVKPNALRTTGVISFTVPQTAGTLSPLLLTLNVDGELRGLQRLIVKCDYAWFFTPRVERCPYAPVVASPAAIQRFERGTMIWLHASDSIYVLYRNEDNPVGRYGLERYDDQFIEGSPEFDPAYKPPAARLQPIRGFGLVWRTQPLVRNNLGWALEPERGFTTCYGYAFGGWKSMRTYLATPEGKLLEFESYYMPTRWRELNTIDGRPVTLISCN